MKLQNKKQFCYKLINAILLKQVTERPSSARYFIKKLDSSFKRAYIITNTALRIIMKELEAYLIYAAWVGTLEEVEQLLAKGVDKNAVDEHNRTPLFMAAMGGHRAVVEQLIAAGADLDLADNQGQTPLFMAAMGGHRAVVCSAPH